MLISFKHFILFPEQLDPENPFYLPQHLRDNPEELEKALQTKLVTCTSAELQQETISTLLE